MYDFISMLSSKTYRKACGTFRLGNYIGNVPMVLGAERTNQKGKHWWHPIDLHAIQCGLRYNWESTVGLYLLSSSMYLVPRLLSDLLCQHFPSSSHSLLRDASSYSQLTCLLFGEAFLPKTLDSGLHFILLSSQDFRFERTHLHVNQSPSSL